MNLYIHNSVQKVISRLNAEGHQAYVVGGAVRDMLLGIVPKDWDVTTSAKAKQVQELFPHHFDTGLKHGTVTVLEDGLPIEVTTYRVDGVYEDHRRPKQVQFTDRLSEDLKRRDFTINGFAYHQATGLVDLFGGLEDLKNKRIRCIGKAEQRFSEDALRMLRALRFSAQLDFEIEPDTFGAIQKKRDLLEYISVERIREELTKFLLAGRRLELLEQSGIMQVILPELTTQTKWELVAGHSPADVAVRYGALLCSAASGARPLLTRLKFDRQTQKEIATLVQWYDASVPCEPEAVRRAIATMGKELFPKWLSLKRAHALAFEADTSAVDALCGLYEQIVEKKHPLCIRDLAISGTDLMQLGYSGREIGDQLDLLFDKVLQHPEWNRAEILLNLAKKAES